MKAMSKPQRIQLSRRKGFDLQRVSRELNGLPAVSVARPTRWGNPFTVAGCRGVGHVGTHAELARRCVDSFRAWLGPHWRELWDTIESRQCRQQILDHIAELRGKNLACWCGLDESCHADVLLESANA